MIFAAVIRHEQHCIMLQFMCAGLPAASRNGLARAVICSLACLPPAAHLVVLLLLAGPCRQHCHRNCPPKSSDPPPPLQAAKTSLWGRPVPSWWRMRRWWAASRTTSQTGQGHRSPQGSRNRRHRTQVGCQAQAYPPACCCACGSLVCPAHAALLTPAADTPPCSQAYRELVLE